MGNPSSKGRSRKPRVSSLPPVDQRTIDDAVVHHSKTHKDVFKTLDRFNQKISTPAEPLISSSSHSGDRTSRDRSSAVRQTAHEESRGPSLSPTYQVKRTPLPKSTDSPRASRSSHASPTRAASPVEAAPPRQSKTKKTDKSATADTSIASTLKDTRESKPRPSSSQPRVAGSSRSKTCSGLTQKGERCKITVKGQMDALEKRGLESNVPLYCKRHQDQDQDSDPVPKRSSTHSKEPSPRHKPAARTQKVKSDRVGFTALNGKGWVDFDDYIPKYLDEDTKQELRNVMTAAVSTMDEAGTVYCFRIPDPEEPSLMDLKVGYTKYSAQKRMEKWEKQCGTKPKLLGCWPRHGKGKNCHRLERLVHLELRDLSRNMTYLTKAFKRDPANKANRYQGKTSSAKNAEVDEEDAIPSPEEIEERRKLPCEGCRTKHKEIFTFFSPASGRCERREWKEIAQPVMKRWGRFVEKYT